MVRAGMLAPITHPYPPPGYGSWEGVTHDLTERLVRDGHDVTLFATAASNTEQPLSLPSTNRSTCFPLSSAGSWRTGTSASRSSGRGRMSSKSSTPISTSTCFGMPIGSPALSSPLSTARVEYRAS